MRPMLNTTPERVAKRTEHEEEPADGSGVAAGAQPLERVLPGAAGVGAGSAVNAADRRAASGGGQLSEELFTLLNRTHLAVANTTAATVKRPSAAH